MATEDNDIELWRRIDAAMESLPRPDRARLTRIEQELPRRVSRRHWTRLAVAAVAAGAAAAAGAAYWVAMTGEPGSLEPPAESGARDAGAVPDRDAHATSTNEDAGAASTDKPEREGRRSPDPVIYQQ